MSGETLTKLKNAILLFLSTTAKRRITPLLSIDIGVTLRCNLRCIMCEWVGWSRARKKDMSFEMYESVLKEAVGLGLRKINYTFGEPTLHPDLPDMLRLAKKYGLTTQLTTNLTIKKSIECSPLVDCYQVSIDGTGEVYEYIRKGAKWTDTYTNLQELAANHHNINILYVIQRSNISEMEKVVELAVQLQIKRVALDMRGRELAIESYKKIKDSYPKIGITMEEASLRNSIDNFRCYHHYFGMVILSDGSCYPCCAYPEIDRTAEPIGNVLTESLQKIWFTNTSIDESVCDRCPIPHCNPFHTLRRKILLTG